MFNFIVRYYGTRCIRRRSFRLIASTKCPEKTSAMNDVLNLDGGRAVASGWGALPGPLHFFFIFGLWVPNWSSTAVSCGIPER